MGLPKPLFGIAETELSESTKAQLEKMINLGHDIKHLILLESGEVMFDPDIGFLNRYLSLWSVPNLSSPIASSLQHAPGWHPLIGQPSLHTDQIEFQPLHRRRVVPAVQSDIERGQTVVAQTGIGVVAQILGTGLAIERSYLTTKLNYFSPS